MPQVFQARDRDQHAAALSQYLPNDKVFCAKNIDGSNLKNLIFGLGGSFKRIDDVIQRIWEGVSLVDTNDLDFIEAWEQMVGIPDDCFTTENLTLDQRRENILVKLRSLNILTEDDFITLINLLGFDANIKQGITFGVFPMTFPIIFFKSAKQARFTMVVELPSSLAPLFSFPFTFPFEFIEPGANIVACLLNQLKPANVDIVFQYTL